MCPLRKSCAKRWKKEWRYSPAPVKKKTLFAERHFEGDAVCLGLQSGHLFRRKYVQGHLLFPKEFLQGKGPVRFELRAKRSSFVIADGRARREGLAPREAAFAAQVADGIAGVADIVAAPAFEPSVIPGQGTSEAFKHAVAQFHSRIVTWSARERTVSSLQTSPRK